jgi:hypothetical protein
MNILRTLVGLTAVACLSASGIGATPADPVDRFTAFAINMGDMTRAATAMIDIDISRWSTDAERDRLAAAIDQKRPDRMVSVLRDLPRVGVLHSPGAVGIPFYYGRKLVAPDKTEQILLITERPIDFQYAWSRPGVGNYPFMTVEMRLNAKGEGDGKISLATRIALSKEHGLVMMEGYDNLPIRLTQVKRAKQ